MNSLEDLNGYAGVEIEYIDQRSPDVLFDDDSASSQSVTVETGSTHLVPAGIEIIEIINYEQSLPTYEIDLQGTTGSTATWGSLPSHLSVDNSVPGLYIVSGMKTVADWDLIKSPTITTPSGFNGYWTYSATVKWNSTTTLETMPWTVAVYSGSVSDLSTPQIYYYTSSATQTVTGNPILTTTTSPATFTVTITPSTLSALTNMTTSGTGGTTSTNGSTKVVTITGTRTQVNSHLNNIVLVTNASISDFNLTFYVTNNFNANTDTVIMSIRNVSVQYLTNPTNVTYNEDTDFYNKTAPTITDASFADSTGYTLTITPSSTSAVTLLNTFGNLGGTESFNATTKVLTLTGTRAQINQHITALSGSTVVGYAITPGDNFDQNFFLTYSVTTPRGTVATKIQNLLIGVTDTDAGNLGVNRTYLGSQGNTIFSTNTPFIGDVTAGATYTVFLTCSFGKFALDSNSTPSTTFSISGTKTYINSKMAGIVFYPNPGVSSNGVFTWAQYKNNVLSFSQDITLTGTAQSYSGARTIAFGATQTWTPTPADVMYGKIAYLLVVGGGGGGGIAGGAGGIVQQATNVSLAQQTYTITVGGGGAASSNWGLNGQGGNTGGTSSAFGLTATGGTGGYIPLSPLQTATPGDGGDNDSYQGGNGKNRSYSTFISNGITYTSYSAAGGGGAGAANPGYGASNFGDTEVKGGQGGDGVLANYFNEYYAWGGGGASSAATFGGRGGLGAKLEPSSSDTTSVNSYYNGGRSNGATSYSFSGPPFNAYAYTGQASGAGTNTGAGGGGGAVESITTAYRASPLYQNTSGGTRKSFLPPTAGSAGIVKIRIEGI